MQLMNSKTPHLVRQYQTGQAQPEPLHFKYIITRLSGERKGKIMEQMKKEVLEMVEKICSSEKALEYVHGFLKAFIERYL